MSDRQTPEQLQREVAHYMLSRAAVSTDSTVDLREFADEYGYTQRRVADIVDMMYPQLDYGVSPMVPFIGYKQLPELRQYVGES